MASTNLMIGIGAEYKGKPAFRQAETATQKLTKNVRNLAGAIGIAFSARAVVNFARASVKASLEAGAQQDRLAQLLKVTSNASAAQVAVLTEQADALERIGVVSKNSITQVQSQLATFDLSISTIEKLTPAILDYVVAEKGATASAAEYKSMTNGLAQALNGNFASLTKTGFVLDEVTKSTIANGSEAKRAAAIVKVLDSTYKGFNESLARTPAGQMQLLANASEDVRVTIGDGIVTALSMITDGNIIKLTNAMRDLAEETSTSIIGFGVLAGFATDKLKKFSRQVEKDLSDNIPFLTLKEGDFDFKAIFAPAFNALNMIGEKSVENTRLLREMMNYPDPQGGRKLDIQLKAKAKADRAANAAMRKFEKDRLATEKKRTLELKKQEKLKKAMKVLDTASNVFDIDLIQNLAALQGKITDDELLRLRTQQAILTDNASLAAKLSQQLLTAQIDAMVLSGANPFDAWTQGAIEALNAMMNLREELGKLTKPTITSGQQLLSNDYIAALVDANDPSFGITADETAAALAGLAALSNLPKVGGSSVPRSNFTYNQGNPMAVEVFVSPEAMAYGISAAVINNTANGNSNTSTTIKSYAGGA
tara:strand:- start:228 stop:2015 length:1788 start_codon:yes stop_codon:yes gene_type:complete